MQPVENPNKRYVLIFSVLGVAGLIVLLAGVLDASSDWGLYAIVFGGMAVLLGAILVPVMYSTGKAQAKTIAALLAGENVLAHWQFDPDEWHKFTENEHARGMAGTRKASVWTFAITLVVMLVIEFFSAGTITGAGAVISLGLGVILTAFLGGILYLSTKSLYRHHQARVGEVYIGPACVYFAGRFHTWEGKWATLTKAAYEPGDPSVVEFAWEYGSAGNKSYQDVRIPVPRGREGEAQNLINWFHGAA